MKADELLAIFNQAIENSTLIVDANLFKRTELDDTHLIEVISTYFPFENSLIFSSDTSTSIKGSTVNITGKGGNDLLKQMELEATFVVDSENFIHMLVIAKTISGYKFQQSFSTANDSPILSHLDFSNAEFHLDTHGNLGEYGPLLAFKGTPILSSPFDSLNFLLKNWISEPFEGKININSFGPNFQLSGPNLSAIDPNSDTTGSQDLTPKLKFPSFKELFFTVGVTSSFNEVDFENHIDSWVGIFAEVEFHTNQSLRTIPVTAKIYDPEELFLLTAKPKGTFEALINDLGAFVGGFDFSLPPNSVPILNQILLDEITIAINPSKTEVLYTTAHIVTQKGEKWTILSDGNKELVAMNNIDMTIRVDATEIEMLISGDFTIGAKGIIRVSSLIQKSKNPTNFTFSASLEEGPIYIQEAIQHFWPSHRVELPNIEVDKLSMQFSTESTEYKGRFELMEQAWEIFEDKLSLRDIHFFLHHSPQEGFEIGVEAYFSVFDLIIFVDGYHDTGGGWTFIGKTEDEQNIKLTEFTKHLLDLLDAKLPNVVPDITLKNLAISFNTRTKDFTFRGETLVEIEAPFIHDNHAAKKLHATVELNYLQDPQTHKHSFSGKMEADLVIGGATFKLSYELGKETHDFQASWEGTDGAVMDFREIPKALGITNFGKESPQNLISLPDDLDLSLTKVVFVHQGHKDTFLLSATSKSYGTVFFVASGASHGVGDAGTGASKPGASGEPRWHYVFGLEYSSQGKMSSLPPSFKNIRKADFMDFKEIGIAVASADFSSFTIPQLPSLSASSTGSSTSTSPSVNSKKIVPDTTLKLHKGVSAYAVMDFSVGHSENKIKQLEKVTGGGHLIISAGYDLAQKAFYLAAVLDGGVSFDAGAGSDLALKNPSLEIDLGSEITFKVFGEFDLSIDHQHINSRLGIEINESEMEGLVQVKFDPDIQGPLGLKGLFLHEADLELGIVFEPPGVNFGFEGKGYIAEKVVKHDPAFQYDFFALVLEMVGTVPNPLLLAFYVDKLNFERILTLFVGGDAHKNFKAPAFLNAVEINQLAFYWADAIVIMPDGTVANPGLRFNGNLSILDFSMHADLKIDPSGVAGHFEMSPVHFGKVLDITGDGKGVFIETDASGKRVQKKINSKNEPESASLTKTEVVAPGGPVLQFNSAHSPYLHASLHAVLFQALRFEVEADVSDEGFHFHLEVELSDIAKAILDITTTKSGFKASSDFGLHLKADLGPIKIADIDFGTIHLDTGFDLHMDLEISAETFAMHITGDFEFEGLRLDLPKLSIHVAPSSFKDIPKAILDHMEENLEHIFSDIFDHIGQAFEEVGKEIVKIEKEFVEEVTVIAEEAEKVAGVIGKEAGEAVLAAEKAGAEIIKDAEEVEQKAVKALEDAGKEIEGITQKAGAEILKIGKEIDHVITEAAHEIAVIGNKIGQEAVAVANSIKRFANYAASEIAKVGHAITHEVRAILNTAKKAADTILRDAKAIANKLAHEAKAIWKEVDNLAAEVKKKLEEAAHAVAHAAKKIFHAISKY